MQWFLFAAVELHALQLCTLLHVEAGAQLINIQPNDHITYLKLSIVETRHTCVPGRGRGAPVTCVKRSCSNGLSVHTTRKIKFNLRPERAEIRSSGRANRNFCYWRNPEQWPSTLVNIKNKQKQTSRAFTDPPCDARSRSMAAERVPRSSPYLLTMKQKSETPS